MLLKFVHSAEICEDHPGNTAYHLPVSISLKTDNVATCKVNSSENNISKQIIVWKKCNANHIEDYASNVNDPIDRVMYDILNDMTMADIDRVAQDVNNALVKFSKTLPKLKYEKHINP